MGRKQKNARRAFDTRMSFTELCHRAGINPRQRIFIRRYFIKKYHVEGGEKYGK